MNALGLQQIPNVEIGILSQMEPDEEAASVSTAPIPFTYLYYVQLVAKKMGVHFDRTIYCKHRGSCLLSAIASSTKAGFLSYLIKAGITTLFNIRKIIKSPKAIFQGLLGKDSIKFGLFICAFLLAFRAIVCGLRRITSP